MRPRLLDLFCGAGGAAMGYHRAGFDIVGVDNRPQPNYPFEFVQADALEFLRTPILFARKQFDRYPPVSFDAIHASPPCQHHTKYRNVVKDITERYDDLVEPTRELLKETGLPYVIENVEGAPLEDPLLLCGSMFDLDVQRHRLFESNIPLDPHPWPCRHKIWSQRFKSSTGRKPGSRLTIEIGSWDEPLERQKLAMRVDWKITTRELSEAIPPRYTTFIGHQLLQHLRVAAYVADSDFTLYVGDVREQLRNLPAESVHCVVTSPPYWGLRDYATEGQLGLEPTPELYVQNMVGVFREVRRVLRRDGTCWLNIGDAFGNKQLYGMPWKVAFALQADGWYLRSDVIWSKPNPMPESVTDRPTKAHEYLFLLTRSPRYFYDQEAVRESPQGYERRGGSAPWTADSGHTNGVGSSSFHQMSAAGRNRRSVWEIPTEPYPGAHFATFPQALVEPCILAGTSERGCCPACSAPWEREIEKGGPRPVRGEYIGPIEGDYKKDGRAETIHNASKTMVRTTEGWSFLKRDNITLGWRPTCECNKLAGEGMRLAGSSPAVPCTVLDPFMGSGTTALVARRLGRKSIGIELNEEYARLCAHRLRQLSLLA